MALSRRLPDVNYELPAHCLARNVTEPVPLPHSNCYPPGGQARRQRVEDQYECTRRIRRGHRLSSKARNILGIDTDNGGEFVNETVLAYCKLRGIELTRARPPRKNDQAWVEQKNGSVVRRLVAYGRFEGTAAAEALTRMYCASRLFVSFFQPSFQLAEKRREGSKVVKRGCGAEHEYWWLSS